MTERRPAAEGDAVFLDRPGYRVTSTTVLVGARVIETGRIYTAVARVAPRGWAGWLLRRPPRYELRMLTADGPMAVSVGKDRALAEELAAAINRAVTPGHWMR